MRNPKVYSALFGLLGALLTAAALLMGFHGQKMPALLLKPSEEAQQLTLDFMDAVSAGDFEDAASMMLGQPRLNRGSEQETELSRLLWDGFTGSIFYEFQSELYASASGICRDISITGLSISNLMDQLDQTAQALLAQEAAIADQDAVFEEDGSYRESFVMNVLYGAVSDLMTQSDVSATREFTLELVWHEGQWWISPRQELLDLFCGSMGQ